MKRRTDHYASYKDPSAKVFFCEDEPDALFRELSPSYLPHYQYFKSSGLSDELVSKSWLLPFQEIQDNIAGTTILKTRKIPFVSYPYEWTFQQWQDAALLSLKIHYQALKFGMILKDATPFNIVFDGAKPVFVDTSSFEIFKQGQPWQAYRQFSENFHMPLLIVKYFGSIGNEIYINNPNGIPLYKGLALLPAGARLNFNTLFYLTLPDKIRRRIKDPAKPMKESTGRFSNKRSLQFADQLFHTIRKIKPLKKRTPWNSYYDANTTHPAYLQEKEQVVKEWLSSHANKTLIDFGCNTGHFSILLASSFNTVIAFDADLESVNELYTACHQKKISNVFPFYADLVNPSPATGFNNRERPALLQRLKADTGLALALLHHLVFTYNVQFGMIAELFAATCDELVIEFVPKEDKKVQLLLFTKKDIFDWYTFENFIAAFEKKFTIKNTNRFANNRILVHFTTAKHE